MLLIKFSIKLLIFVFLMVGMEVGKRIIWGCIWILRIGVCWYGFYLKSFFLLLDGFFLSG